MRTITIPAEHEIAIRREIADSDSDAAGRILEAMRSAVAVTGGIEIKIAEDDACWAERYVGAAPIIGKFAHCFAPPGPRPGNEDVLRDVAVEIKL